MTVPQMESRGMGSQWSQGKVCFDGYSAVVCRLPAHGEERDQRYRAGAGGHTYTFDSAEKVSF